MALPHYNPNLSNEAQQHQQTVFPVILVPEEAPLKSHRLRQFLRSRRWLTTVVGVALLAVGIMLWLLLDPTNKTFDSKPFLWQLLWPASALGLCSFFLLLALWLGREPKEARDKEATGEPLSTETKLLPPVEVETLPIHLPPTLPAARTSPQMEFCFEQWDSEPVEEILDEALLAEVFDDNLLAPDHLVFSVKVGE